MVNSIQILLSRETDMTESPYEGLFLEMQTLSQKYALGKTARSKFDKDLKELQKKFSSEMMAQRIHAERKGAFYQGFLAAFLVTAVLYGAIRILQNLLPYWG
jgi:hypothetical protein